MQVSEQKTLHTLDNTLFVNMHQEEQNFLHPITKKTIQLHVQLIWQIINSESNMLKI